jgi:DNA-binding transcriptional LysR family regulator
METRRLHLLLELSRLGTMREVAETHGLTTSTVSQQVAALAREVGTPLVESVGRGVRLTPAGHRLAEHAVTILAAVDAARLDLDPDAAPAGRLRVGGFATAVRASLLPVLAALRPTHPRVEVLVSEYEPLEAYRMLADDDLDLALTYDYDVAPAAPPEMLRAVPLWSTPWGLGVPDRREAGGGHRGLAGWARQPWIVNSRNTADELAAHTLAAVGGFTPRISHSIDSLDLVEELILAGQGVGLLPRHRPTRPGVRVLPLTDPAVVQRAYAVTRLGRETWPPLRLLLDRLAQHRVAHPYADHPRSSGPDPRSDSS